MVANDIKLDKVRTMGNILNPDKENSFISLANRKNKYLFVDKTNFIEITNNRLNEDNRFLAVTRPRRFGKTVTADMLLAYYSKEYDGKKIFDEFDEHTTSKDFELYIEKLIGSTVQRAVILRENELIIDFGCCYLRFYCHKNGIESWRYFIIKGTHLVASDRWLELER